MSKKSLVIHEKVAIASRHNERPIGEAPNVMAAAPQHGSSMSKEERYKMVKRLESSIGTLMDETHEAHKANLTKHAQDSDNIEHMTRLITNEFFFYTKEPLTVPEFEYLQNQIAQKAKTMPKGVQLILSSFAVKNNAGSVMNVTPHISCGDPPDFHLIVKNNTSGIDVRYKGSDNRGNTYSHSTVDHDSAYYDPGRVRPQYIKIDGKVKEFEFKNIVRCKTPSGTQFLTAVDIGIDHDYGVAQDNYKWLDSEEKKQPISHVVVSNSYPEMQGHPIFVGATCSTEVDKKKCLGSTVMHVDPCFPPEEYQSSKEQQLKFGNGPVTTFDVVGEPLRPANHTKNNYAHKTHTPSTGREHKSYTVSLDKVEFQKSQDGADFTAFKNKYQAQKGDYLKTTILDDLQKRIEDTTTPQELADLKQELKQSYEVDVLKKGQGWFTETLGLQTSSQKALEDMLKQQEKYLSDVSPKLD